jgi:hypothetical protein
LEQPPTPPNPTQPAASEQAADDDSLDDPTTAESVHLPLITTIVRRESIAYAFLHALGAPPEKDWLGHGRTVSIIQKLLVIPLGLRNSILKVLQDVDFCMVAGVLYDSSVDKNKCRN